MTRGARALAQLEDLVDRLPRFEVVGAERVERWDPASAAWRPLGGADRLVPGDILTGASRASLETSAQRYRLAADLYVVTVEGRIEPLPDPDAPSLGPLPDEPSVETLIERFRSGSPQARADAQRALTQLWMTHGDPEPDLVTRVAEAAAGVERAAGLPSTAEAWETWWRRVQPVVARAGT